MPNVIYGKSNETINRIVNEYNQLLQNENTERHDLVGKVIHRKFMQETEIWPYY